MTIDHDAIAARVRQARRAGALLAGPVYIKLADMAGAYLDLYDEVQRLRAERDWLRAERDRLRTQCCMCGKTGLSTIEDGGPECELDDGRWVCSVDCYDRAVLNHLVAEAERDRLRDALANIAVMGFDNDPAVSNAIAKSAVNQARAALKGDTK